MIALLVAFFTFHLDTGDYLPIPYYSKCKTASLSTDFYLLRDDSLLILINQTEQWHSQAMFRGFWSQSEGKVLLSEYETEKVYSLQKIGTLFYLVGSNVSIDSLRSKIFDILGREPLLQELTNRENSDRQIQSIKRIEYFIISDRICYSDVMIEVPADIVDYHKFNFDFKQKNKRMKPIKK